MADIYSGEVRRVIEEDASTMSDRTVTITYDGEPLRRPDGRGVEFSADGIALSPDGKTLYSLPTDALTGWATSAAVPDAVTARSLAGRLRSSVRTVPPTV